MSMKYAPRSLADIAALIDGNPLCWIVSFSSAGFAATPLPLLVERGPDGAPVALFGHFARANPHVAALQAAPRAMVLVNGPNAYISPELVGNPTWVPTWNYAMATMEVDVEFLPGASRESVERLTDHMEAGRDRPWTVDQAASRLDALLPHIVAFRAHVRVLDGRFKLGRDETPAALNDIMHGMDAGALRDWMGLYNSDRLSGERTERVEA